MWRNLLYRGCKKESVVGRQGSVMYFSDSFKNLCSAALIGEEEATMTTGFCRFPALLLTQQWDSFPIADHPGTGSVAGRKRIRRRIKF